ncbi:hypothetical protein NMY22_g5914 [Coprinellus aureogranulatus]|nr:hypothetical protein NMY22_g5914 [Coprinellus aureogranulatus]
MSRPWQSPHPAANVFAGSTNPTFQEATFNAAAGDVISPTFIPTFSPIVNVHVEATGPGVSPADEGYLRVASQEADPKKEPAPIQRALAFSPDRNKANKVSTGKTGVKRLLGFLSPRRDKIPPTEEMATGAEVAQYASDDAETPPLTPDVSCSSSPYSSQEDFLDGFLDYRSLLATPKTKLTTARVPLTTSQTYVWEMWKTGKGFAMWQPESLKVGDFGEVLPDGRFNKFFNIWDDEEGLQRTFKRLGGVSLRLPNKTISAPREDPSLRRGSRIAEGASSETVYDESDTRKIMSFEFYSSCESTSGALLAATSAAEVQELEDYRELRTWIAQHPELIFEHANSPNVGPIYAITSVTNADSWALAAFRENVGSGQRMTLRNLTGDGDAMPSYDWVRTWRCSEGRVGSSNRRDQTLFVRGFKLDFSAGFRSRMESGPSSSPGTSSDRGFFGPDHSKFSGGRAPHGGHAGGGSAQREGAGPSSSGSASGSHMASSYGNNTSQSHGGDPVNEGRRSRSMGLGRPAFDQKVTVQSFPLNQQDCCHPSDAINKYLLNTTGADFALCHDDQWQFTLANLDNSDDLLEAILDEHDIEIQHGVSLLSSKGIDTNAVSSDESDAALDLSADLHSIVVATTSSSAPSLQEGFRAIAGVDPAHKQVLPTTTQPTDLHRAQRATQKIDIPPLIPVPAPPIEKEQPQASSSVALLPPLEPNRRLGALLIGINYMPLEIRKVPPSHSMAKPRATMRSLKEPHRYDAQHNNLQVPVDQEDLCNIPTKENISKQLDDFVANAQREDTSTSLVFFFAGHSTQEDTEYIEGADGMDEFMIAFDYRRRQDSVLKRGKVVRIPDETRLAEVFDTCHTATMLDMESCNGAHFLRVRESKHSSQISGHKEGMRRRSSTENTVRIRIIKFPGANSFGRTCDRTGSMRLNRQPATTPRIGELTIHIPGIGGSIVVSKSPTQDHLTVQDVLDAIRVRLQQANRDEDGRRHFTSSAAHVEALLQLAQQAVCRVPLQDSSPTQPETEFGRNSGSASPTNSGGTGQAFIARAGWEVVEEIREPAEAAGRDIQGRCRGEPREA